MNVWGLAEKFLPPSWGIPQRAVVLRSPRLTGLELYKELVCPSWWGFFCHLQSKKKVYRTTLSMSLKSRDFKGSLESLPENASSSSSLRGNIIRELIFFFYFQEQPWRKLASRAGTRLRKWGHISEVTKVLLDSISISSKTRAATVSQHHAPEVLLDVSDPGTDPVSLKAEIQLWGVKSDQHELVGLLFRQDSNTELCSAARLRLLIALA